MSTALEGVRGQRHAPAALYPRERPGTHCTGGRTGPRAGLDRCGKSRPHRDSIPRHVQHIASRYTDLATEPIYVCIYIYMYIYMGTYIMPIYIYTVHNISAPFLSTSLVSKHYVCPDKYLAIWSQQTYNNVYCDITDREKRGIIFWRPVVTKLL